VEDGVGRNQGLGMFAAPRCRSGIVIGVVHVIGTESHDVARPELIIDVVDRSRLPLRELQSSAERTPTPRTRYGTLSYRQSFVGSDASSTCENIVQPLTGTSATWIVPVSASVM